MCKSLFISFEGTEGVGKSTQVKLLKKYLQDLGYEVLLTHEPGGTLVGEEVTKIVKFYNGKEPLAQLTESLLFCASRHQLIQQIINPALQKGVIVISDRFYDSTFAYQGYARGVDIDILKQLNRLTVGDVHPNVTFLLNSDIDTLERAKQQTAKENHGNDRFEDEDNQFFDNVKEGFLALAKQDSQRIKIIDATLSIQEVFKQIKSIVNEFVKEK